MGTYGPDADKQDEKRINVQMDRIRAYMLERGATDEWCTLGKIRIDMEARWPMSLFPEASVSAQLRHLRKERFGAYLVEKRRVPGAEGLWEYKVSPGVPKIEESELFAEETD